MSKFVKVMVALLAIAVFAAPAMAEDRLGLSGQMRVLFNYTDDGGDNTKSFVSQRLRVGGKLSIAEGVSVTFRTDITESDWGSGNKFGSGRTSVGGSDFQSQHWDRAHLDLDFDSFALRAGQQFVSYGVGSLVNGQSNGLKATIKGAVPVQLFWMLTDDNGSSTTESDDYFYGANIAHKTDMYAANVVVAGEKADAYEVYGLGVDTTFNLEAVKLLVSLNYLTGDVDDTTDATGLQGMVDASFAVSDAVTVGGQFFYAQGSDADEMQVDVIGNDFDGWDPMNAIGVGLENTKETFGRIYSIFNYDDNGDYVTGAGVMAVRAYTTAKLNDATTVGASVAYIEPEDEDMTAADSAIQLAAGVAYKIMANTAFKAQIAYEDIDEAGEEEVLKLHTGLFVNF